MTNEDRRYEFERTKEVMARIETRDDFFEFLEVFEADLDDSREFRELFFLSGVEGMATYIHKNQRIPEQPTWKAFADILFTGMHHG